MESRDINNHKINIMTQLNAMKLCFSEGKRVFEAGKEVSEEANSSSRAEI